MKIFKSKNNINEEKIKFKKGLSVVGGSIKKDWVFLVSTITIVLIVGLVFSWSVFRSIQNESFLSEEAAQATNSLKVNTDQLERVVDNLNSKKQQFDLLTGGSVREELLEE